MYAVSPTVQLEHINDTIVIKIIVIPLEHIFNISLQTGMLVNTNPPLVPFRRLGIFVLSIVVPVDSAV